jgi:hypothetical protein
VKARLCEDHVIAAFYNNACNYGSFGKEMCIALDIAFGRWGLRGCGGGVLQCHRCS